MKTKDRVNWFFLGGVAGFLIGAFVAVVASYFFIDFLENSNRKTFLEPSPSLGGKSVADALLKKMFISFEQTQDLAFFRPTGNTTYELSTNYATHGSYSLMTKMSIGEGFPGLGWEAQETERQDWRPYKEFRFDVYNATDYYVKCEIKFKSGVADSEKTYSASSSLEPLKINHIVIPLVEVAKHCDLAQISYIKIFPVDPQVDVVLYFDNIGVF